MKRLPAADTQIKRARAFFRGIQIARRRDVQDLTGRRFGRLLVIGLAPRISSGGSVSRYFVVCDCGSRKSVRRDVLVSGETTSCGCFRREAARDRYGAVLAPYQFRSKDSDDARS